MSLVYLPFARTITLYVGCDSRCSHTEVDDMIRKLANVLLTRTLGGCLSGLIKQHLTLLQVAPPPIGVFRIYVVCVCYCYYVTARLTDHMYT